MRMTYRGQNRFQDMRGGFARLRTGRMGYFPAQHRNGLSGRTLSCLGGDDFLRAVIVGNSFLDPGNELRLVTLEHLPDAWPKLVEDVYSRVAANGRT